MKFMMSDYALDTQNDVTYEFKKELFDVEGGKQLTLSVNDDLSGRLAWDGLIRLHNLKKRKQQS